MHVFAVLILCLSLHQCCWCCLSDAMLNPETPDSSNCAQVMRYARKPFEYFHSLTTICHDFCNRVLPHSSQLALLVPVVVDATNPLSKVSQLMNEWPANVNRDATGRKCMSLIGHRILKRLRGAVSRRGEANWTFSRLTCMLDLCVQPGQRQHLNCQSGAVIHCNCLSLTIQQDELKHNTKPIKPTQNKQQSQYQDGQNG